MAQMPTVDGRYQLTLNPGASITVNFSGMLVDKDIKIIASNGSGAKYEHNIYIERDASGSSYTRLFVICFQLIDGNSTAYTSSNMEERLNALGLVTSGTFGKGIPSCGRWASYGTPDGRSPFLVKWWQGQNSFNVMVTDSSSETLNLSSGLVELVDYVRTL